MEITINIKCKEYLIKRPRTVNTMTSMRIPLAGTYVGTEMLIIPIIDDLIMITEKKDGYLISVCGLEMYKKKVVSQTKKHPTKAGHLYVPTTWVGCEVLLVPLETENYIKDEV